MVLAKRELDISTSGVDVPEKKKQIQKFTW